MSDDEALRERLAVVLYERDLARLPPWRANLPMDVWRYDADALMPLIWEYRTEGERAAWVYYRDAAERESDARAEAAHAKGYELGRRDGQREGVLDASYAAWQRDWTGEDTCTACGGVTRPVTRPPAARVGTDGPA